MNVRVICTIWIFILLLFSASTGSLYNVVEDVAMKSKDLHDSSEPIRINSDTDFADQGWPGDGSEDDPYVIQDYEINGTGHGCGIFIGNTTVHFVVRDNYVHNASGRSNIYYRNTGLFFYNVTNGRAEGNVITNSSYGIRLNEYSSNNTIIENEVSYNTDYGIFLYRSSGNTLIHNHVFNNTRGIYVLHHSHQNKVSDNLIEYNIQNGIHTQLSSNNTFSNNNISSNENGGIYLSNSGYTYISNNEVSSNSRRGIYVLNSVHMVLFENIMVNNGISIFGGSLVHWDTHTIPTNNTVNGKPVHYWKDTTGGTVPSGAGQVILVNCTGIVVENQEVNDTDTGITLGFSNENILSNNTVYMNSYGISLSESVNNTLYNNHIHHNSRGIYVYYSDDNELEHNTIHDNDYGFHIHSSTNSTLDSNSITDNDFGIYLFRSIDTTLDNNEMIGHGIFIGGDMIEYWNTHSIDTSNTVNGKPVRYWKDGRSGTVPPDAGQVILANCDDVSVREQNISGDYAGILLGFSNSNTIINNTASNNTHGIYLHYSHENIISLNMLSDNTRGIYLSDSKETVLSDNEMHNNTYGIYMLNSDKNNASGNTLRNNTQGIYIYHSASITLHNNEMVNDGIMIRGNLFRYWDTHDINASNTVNGKPVHYWKNKTGGTVPSGAGQVILANCMNVIIERQLLNGGAAGIQLGYSVENTIYNNTVRNNQYGIYLYASSDNMIYHNNLIDNENQAYEEGVNQWDDDYPSGGNYWSDYKERYPDASEINDSGIWDTAYVISGVGNSDRYPLMYPKGALVLTIDKPEQGTVINEENVTVRWSSSGGLGVREHRIRLDYGEWICVDQDTEHTFHDLEDGHHGVEVEVADGVFDSVTDEVNFTSDTTPPLIDIISPYNSEIFNMDSVNVEWEGNDATTGISHYQVRLAGEDWIHTSTNTTYALSGLSDGYHRTEVKAWDAAGHNSTQEVNFTVDTAPPIVDIISPRNDETFGSDNFTVEWEGSDTTSGIWHYQVRLAGEDWIYTGTNTSYTFSGLSNGYHRTEVRAWDAAGHNTTKGVNFIVDTTPPVVTITTPPHGEIFHSNVIMVEWYGEDETSGISHYDIRINEEDWIEVGASTYHLFMDLSEGEHTVFVRGWDNASHTSTDSITFRIESVDEDDDDVGLHLIIFVVAATLIIFSALFYILWNIRGGSKEHYELKWYEKESKKSRRHDYED